MRALKDFVDVIDTPGGHILICVLLGMVGVMVMLKGHEMAAQALLAFFQVAAYAMRGTAKANEQATTTATVVSTTETPALKP